MPRIVQLLASPVHRYVGRPADGPGPASPGELVEEVRIRAGLGIVGDRYFGKQAHRDASVTVIASDHFIPLLYLAGLARAGGRPADVLVGARRSRHYPAAPRSDWRCR
jgi:hypothetical protein